MEFIENIGWKNFILVKNKSKYSIEYTANNEPFFIRIIKYKNKWTATFSVSYDEISKYAYISFTTQDEDFFKCLESVYLRVREYFSNILFLLEHKLPITS